MRARPILVFRLLVAAGGLGLGCAQGVMPAAEVSVAVSPHQATVASGGTVAFTAVVTGGTIPGVTWSVQESGGGTLDGSGKYTAPAKAGTFHVVATSVADTHSSDIATVTVMAAPVVAVSATPHIASVMTGGALSFTATVSGTSPGQSTAVTWSVQEAAGGTVDSSGHYVAPGTTGTYHVVATSVADASKKDTATVMVTSTPVIAVSISPQTASAIAGGTVSFTATVTGATAGQSTAVTWSVQEGASGGSVSGTGVYTAPGTAGTYHVVATSVADISKNDTTTVTVTLPPPIVVTVSPVAATTTAGGTVAFTATVTGGTGGQSTAVTWSVQEVGGGTISTSGLYTAPAVSGTYHVIATSQVDTSAKGNGTVTVASPADSSIVPADRRTIWNPGILSDGLLGLPLTPDRIPTRTSICATANAAIYGNNSTDATAHIQGLLNGCGSGKVVFLPAGVYRTSGTLRVPSGVVLRGAGPTQTKILRDPNAGYPNRVIWMGDETWGWDHGTLANVVGDIAKGAMSITVSSASGFAAGDFIHIDQIDDETYNTHTSMGGIDSDSAGSRTGNLPWRTLRAMNQVASVSGNVLNLVDPVHHTFPAAQSPQVIKLTGFTQWAGVEDLYVTGGVGRGGTVGMTKCAYCWVKHVESNGRFVTGDRMNAGANFHLTAEMAYRVVIRDSYVHDSNYYGNSTDSYGIVIWEASTNCLVENNISMWMNKPIQFQFSGGGNVVAYNYVDNALDTNSPDQNGNAFWMEEGIDAHCQFPHHELIEGNYANQMGPDASHGGTGWFTFFRNHASGQCRGGTTIGDHAPASWPDQYENLVGIAVNERSSNATSIGNVLLLPGTMRWPKAYQLSATVDPGNAVCAYRLGTGDPSVEPTVHRHLDFDYATNLVYDNPANPVKTLPDSLYLTSKPAFFGSNPWPWVDPRGATPADRVKTLPAKARYEAGTP